MFILLIILAFILLLIGGTGLLGKIFMTFLKLIPIIGGIYIVYIILDWIFTYL